MRFTQTPTPSITATPSLTPSITPTQTATGTVCPGLTPTATPTISLTPSQTATNTQTPSLTPSITASPTETQIYTTPTSTLNPTPTPTANCLVYNATPPTISGEKIEVAYIDCDGVLQNLTIYWTSGGQLFCARSYTVLDYGINGSVSPWYVACT